MRINQPVTQQERTFSPDVKLISTTDLRGIIQHCNDDFVKISGFTRDELIGQPHNIVRHPDMPPLAYKIMWEHLKAGRPWMGLVKNRSKNGDYYWVDAYVTPVTEHGKVIGYESVRSCPSRQKNHLQQQETDQTAAAMHQMTTTINEVSGHVQETAGRAEHANELAVLGRDAARTTRKAIEALRQTVAEIANSVTEVSEQTQKIATVAQMIEQIAEQTNLLALNAAIEAARAGEQGRGFAVVANKCNVLHMSCMS